MRWGPALAGPIGMPNAFSFPSCRETDPLGSRSPFSLLPSSRPRARALEICSRSFVRRALSRRRAQRAEIRLLGPSARSPLGGAGVRIWLQVTNPNPFGFTLSTIDADLILEGNHAATGNFPLGLPLTAGQETVVPLDLSISFADVPALSRSIGRLATGGAAAYQLDGTVGINAGHFGTPTFGPMTLTTGELQVR